LTKVAEPAALSVDERIVHGAAADRRNASGAALARDDGLVKVPFNRRGETTVGFALEAQRDFTAQGILPQKLPDRRIIARSRKRDIKPI
jgi:hypothetical protein